MSTINSVGVDPSYTDSSSITRTNTLDKQAFLNLLVTQLKYQDPLNPMENTEFVAQLSQFSSLEQLWNVNETLQNENVLSQSIHNSLMSSLIGKDVKAVGSITSLPEEGQADLSYSIAEPANVTIAILNETGNLVRTINIGQQEAGYHNTHWDGLDNTGNRVPAGPYTIQLTAVDVNGEAISANSIMRGQITGIRFVDGSPILLMGDAGINPTNILEVVLPE